MFRNSANERFERLIEALGDRKSDPLLIQHIGDCERRQDRIERALDAHTEALKIQSDTSLAMHMENRKDRTEDNKAANARFIKLLFLVLTGTLSPYAGKVYEFLVAAHGG